MAFTEISFANIKAEIERFLKKEHNKANTLYSPASPFGQVLNVESFNTEGFVSSSAQLIDELDESYLVSGSINFREELEDNIFITSGSFGE